MSLNIIGVVAENRHDAAHLADSMIDVGDEITAVTQQIAVLLMRASIGGVFVWLGALRASGDGQGAVVALGAVDVALGIALAVRRRWPVTAGLVAVHALATVCALATTPAVDPLLAGATVEALLKNVALVVAAAIVVVSAPSITARGGAS